VLDDNRPQILILESTYAPGTTRSVVAPIVADRYEIGIQVSDVN